MGLSSIPVVCGMVLRYDMVVIATASNEEIAFTVAQNDDDAQLMILPFTRTVQTYSFCSTVQCGEVFLFFPKKMQGVA